MKKNKIKKVIGLGVLLLFSSLLLWNCEPELIEKDTINQGSEHPFTRSIVSEHYLEFHKPEVYKHLNSLGTKKEQGQRQNYVSDEYGFTYDLDHVQIIETDLFTQYSLRVVGSETDDTHVENYVFMDYANGEQEQLLFTFKGTYTLDGFEINHHQTQVQVLEGTSLFTDRCVNGMQIVDLTITISCYDVPCTGDNHHLVGEYCPCGTEYNCHPPTTQCDTATIQSWSRCGGGSSGEGDDPNNDNGQPGGGDQTGGGNSGDTNIPVIPISEDLRLNTFVSSLDIEKRSWWNDPVNTAMVTQLKRHLLEQNYSELAEEYVTGSIELEQIANCQGSQYASCITLSYNPGKINNRDDFSYTHIGTDGAKTAYKLTTGELVVASPSKLIINSSENGIWTSEVSNSRYYYIKADGKWAQLLIKENITSLADELKELFHLAATELGQFFGTYVVPFEDIKILITGTDFAGEPASRWLAAGMLLAEVAPISKIFKVIKFAVASTDAWRIVRTIGNKTYTRVVHALSENTLAVYQAFSRNTQDLVNQAHRSGEVLDDVVEEAAEVLEDEFIQKGSKLDWSEVKALWRRGNDFNKKAIDQEWYDYHEIHLVNGKRLDSYDPFLGEIVSRKATDLNNIQFSTFVNYLKELTTKYKVGTQIRSNKYPDLDGDLLEGIYYLEIPSSNQSLSNIQDYIDHAWDNYQVKLRFRPE